MSKSSNTQPISYYGGKQRMAHNIIPLIPKHTVYCEPFCGGASIMFKKPWPDVTNNHHYMEVINDIDGDLINFYRQLRDNGEKLTRLLQLTPYSEYEHREAKTKNYEGLSDIERARRYFININTSFSKTLDSGWGRAKFGNNLPIGFKNKVDNLSKFIERTKGLYISNTDAIKCIKDWDSPQTFFYVDPPYVRTDQRHYSGYTEDNFKDLIEALEQCQGSFLLSCYPNDLCPNDWERFEFEATMSASIKKADKNKKRVEVVYKRLNRVPVREEIQKLYDSGKFDCFTG